MIHYKSTFWNVQYGRYWCAVWWGAKCRGTESRRRPRHCLLGALSIQPSTPQGPSKSDGTQHLRTPRGLFDKSTVARLRPGPRSIAAATARATRRPLPRPLSAGDLSRPLPSKRPFLALHRRRPRRPPVTLASVDWCPISVSFPVPTSVCAAAGSRKCPRP
jgi:hypothetical protein